MKVLNLDKIISNSKTITMFDRDYVIPEKLPLGIFFRYMKNSSDIVNAEALDKLPAIEESFNILYDIFCIKNKDVNIDKIKSLSLEQLTELQKFIFNNEEEEETQEKNLFGDQNELHDDMLKM